MVFNISLLNLKHLQNLFKNYLKKKYLKTWDGNHLDFTFEKKPYQSKYIGEKQTML